MTKWQKTAKERYGTTKQVVAAQMKKQDWAKKERIEKEKRRAARWNKVDRALKSIGL